MERTERHLHVVYLLQSADGRAAQRFSERPITAQQRHHATETEDKLSLDFTKEKKTQAILHETTDDDLPAAGPSVKKLI